MLRTCAIMLTAALAVGLSEQEMRVVVEQALDQPTTLTIENAPLEEAFATIVDKTGLGVTIGPDALAYLPYGDATRLNARIENVRLRDGIQAMCNSIGMTYRATERGIEIVPTAALARLGRTATWTELESLASLMQSEWSGDKNTLEDWRDRVQFEGLDGSFDQNWSVLTEQVREAGSGSGDRVLTRACEAIGCTWFPWDENIVILTLKQQLLHQLERPVSLRYNNRALAEVIRGLSRQAGIPITIDPASAAELPDRVKQNFSLLAEGVTVREALEQIGIATGLAYEVGDDSVVLRNPDRGTAYQQQAASEQSPRTRDPIVGKVIIPSEDGKYTFEWFVRESDLTEQENARRKKVVDEAVESMKKDLP